MDINKKHYRQRQKVLEAIEDAGRPMKFEKIQEATGIELETLKGILAKSDKIVLIGWFYGLRRRKKMKHKPGKISSSRTAALKRTLTTTTFPGCSFSSAFRQTRKVLRENDRKGRKR
jgi:hypothetical protein